MKAFRVAQPKTLDGAVSVAGESSRMLAGGTDLLALMKERVAEPDLLINLKTIPGLGSIEAADEELAIGALVTLAELAASEVVAEGWPALVSSALRSATPQIRNVATIGGNLCQNPRCWYYRDETYTCIKKGGDTCPAIEGENEFHAIFDNGVCASTNPSNLAPVLIAHDAEIEIRRADETERVPAEKFWLRPEPDCMIETVLEPEDIVTRIILKTASRSRTSAYVEAREKQSYDWAVCGATVNLTLDGGKAKDARIVLSAVAPTPMRRPDLEAMIRGRKLDGRTIDAVCDKAIEGATPLRDNAYKTILVKTVLRRAFHQAMEAGK